MYTCDKLSRIAEQMEKTASEEEIKKLAEKEFRIVELCSERITSIAKKLWDDELLSHKQYEQISQFRNNLAFVHFALEDIIHNKTSKTMKDKIAYLKKMIIKYEGEIESLETVLGDSLEHVKAEIEKLREEVEKME